MHTRKAPLLISLVMAFGVIFSGFTLNTGHAQLFRGAKDAACSGVTATSGGRCDSSSARRLNTVIATALRLISILVGVAAVIMIIVGGFKFLTSQGDASAIASARNTVLYALIGLIIAAMAQIIVRYVLNRV